MSEPSDGFMIAQFAKALVAIRLDTTDDSCATAAALVREAAQVALKSRPAEADIVISDACYGAMQALLMARQDLSRGATLMLGQILELAAPLHVDPAALTEYALEGFARMRRLMTQDQLIDMLETLESRYKGTAPVFAKALARQPDPARRLLAR